MCHSPNRTEKVFLYFRFARCRVNKISILQTPVSDIVPVRMKINDTNKISRLECIFLGAESKVY